MMPNFSSLSISTCSGSTVVFSKLRDFLANGVPDTGTVTSPDAKSPGPVSCITADESVCGTNGILAMLIVLADCPIPLESAEHEQILKEGVLVLF